MENTEEKQYLDLINEILEKGHKRMDRTGTGTLSLFGKQMKFNLRNNAFPLLTTKKVFVRVVFKELMFFIRGQTDNKILKEKRVNIWNKNATREFFDKNGINRAEDDLGPVYGFQWRHFGAEYKTCQDNYKGEGIDQLKEVLKSLKEDPYGRRHIISAWNPSDLKEMALPPCHCFVQFYVKDNELSCMLYQRSCDMGLGVPFNIASYSILTILMAKILGYQTGEFIHTLGDVHVYTDHIEPLKIQLEREPLKFPTLVLKDREYKGIEDFEWNDIIINDYNPHDHIKMNMSA